MSGPALMFQRGHFQIGVRLCSSVLSRQREAIHDLFLRVAKLRPGEAIHYRVRWGTTKLTTADESWIDLALEDHARGNPVARSVFADLATKDARTRATRANGAKKSRTKRSEKKTAKDAPLLRYLERIHTDEDGGPRKIDDVLEDVKRRGFKIGRSKLAQCLADLRKPVRV